MSQLIRPTSTNGYIRKERPAASPSMTDPASRFRLFQLLADLPQPQFEGLLFALNIPPGNTPASRAPQAERVRAVLVWAESPIG